MGCLNLRVAGALAMAAAFVATLGAQQPAVTGDDDDITIRGCVREVDLRTTNPSLLVWSRSDLMLVGAEAAGADAPNPIGTAGFAGRVFYWLDDDEDLAKHVGQRIEIRGDLEDIEKGEIEIDQDGAFTKIEIKLDELPGHTLCGVIEEVSRSDLKASPRNLSNKAGGELATTTDAAGVERPLSTSFQARVRLENPDGLLRLGLRGTAKIHAGRQTLAARFYRYLSQTFRIKRA